MGFREFSSLSLARFNSAISSNFLDFYENYVMTKMQKKSTRMKSRTFAPSCLRCDRKSWFRLRGTEPDFLENPDMTLNYTAEVGTARHAAIQQNLKKLLGQDWIDVSDYLSEIKVPYNYEYQKSGYETLINISNPPIKFACDGIIRFNNKLFLLEIKTSDYASWNSLNEPKQVHMDQVKCYSTLLQLPNVLILYEDRQYGGLKCYQINVSAVESQRIMDKFSYIQDMVKANLAPERLNKNDYMCKNCEYRKKCDEWG